ncbi:uncharacterized protein LOC113865207 [Abrus precatorius]|uniref:Uncharacterized protein LOC113865207 n=1 Tax=Abrus precatorius TaxID=3816 RepID=A0A8B8LKS0_ABRPR|nr:uncharacterized protein LOC113865207 [Abrus precatorius]
MVNLNPEAPEFCPTQQNKLQLVQVQSLSSPNFPTSIFTPQHYYFMVSSLPSRELHPFYYPSLSFPLPSFIHFHDATVTPQQETPDAEPTRFHSTTDEPNPLDAHAVHQHEEEIVADAEACGSKGLVQKQVFKAFITCGRMDSHRSDGFKLKAYASRRRKVEEAGQVKKSSGHLRNRHVMRHPHEQYFRAFPRKKRCCPVVPVRVDGDETTVMIKNIPSKYTRDMLVEFLDDHCMVVNRREKEAVKVNGEEHNILAFDFVYLPIDFKSGLNKGYAFVNFTKPKAAWKFLLTASNMKWSLFQSHKIREVVAARLQGKEKLERHFETMSFPCESEDVLPVCFSPPRDGVIKGKQRTMGKLIKCPEV